MTILIDIRPLMDARYSGVSEYIFRLLNALFKIDNKNNYILLYNSFSQVRDPKFDFPNVKIVRKKIPNRILNYPLLWLLRRPRFDKWVGEKVDIFFMPHINYMAVSKNVKTVLAVHDISFLIEPRFFSWWKNLWHTFVMVKQLVRRFDRIVVFSEHTKRDLAALCKVSLEHISVIHSGIDQSFKVYDKNDAGIIETAKKYNLTKPFILFLSTLEPRKNVEGLVLAFNELKKKHQGELELVLAGGRGWKSAPIFSLIEKSPYKNDIKVLDYVPENERAFLYSLAKVFAYPSFYEGFGFPPLEAMACGTPVVVAGVSSLPEVVGKAGILIDPYNPSSIALGLEQVLSNLELSADLSKKGLEQAKQFNWERAAERYLRLFATIQSYENEQTHSASGR